MAIGESLDTFLRGQRLSDVARDPEQERAAKRLERLAAAAEEEATGKGPTAGEVAAGRAGESALQQLESGVASQAAGVRGPGSLFAQRTAQQSLAQGAQDIAGQTARASAEARSTDRQTAAARLLALTRNQEELRERERLEREAKRKKGFLGTLGAVGGGIIGGIYGGPAGATAGAGVGSGIGRSFER